MEQRKQKPFLERIDNQLTKSKKKRPWLSETSGISLSTINSWFAHNRLPRVDHAYEIAKVLGVSLEYLVTGREPESYLRNPEIITILNLIDDMEDRELIQLQGVIRFFNRIV